MIEQIIHFSGIVFLLIVSGSCAVWIRLKLTRPTAKGEEVQMYD